MGPSGAGKSTLLKLLSRDITATRGRILFKEKDISFYSPGDFATQVSVVHQQQENSLSFLVKDYVIMGRYPHLQFLSGYKKEDYEIALSSIAAVGIEELSERSVTTLSGGEVQLVALARAICQGKDVILLDEPVAHLDPGLSRKVFSILQKLNEEGTTVLVVAHDINLAAAYAKTFWAIKDGRILFQENGEGAYTSENIEELYGIRSLVGKHPETGKPVVYM
jgi:ABC-type cobalamin/Fe3+-siderophores transport system ATPase subunit